MIKLGAVLGAFLSAATTSVAAATGSCSFDKGYDYFVQGQGATYTNVPDAATCCTLVGGGYFTYQTQTKDCYAKNSTAGRQANSNCVSGSGGGGGNGQCALDNGHDYFIQDQGATWSNVADAAACCALCSAASDCPYFTYQTKTKNCYNKPTSAGRQANSACISGRNTAYTAPPVCQGEFALSNAGACCTMNGECGSCKRGEYLCPSDQKTCVASAADYVKCPGLKGTHLDWTLPEDARLDYLVAHTSLAEQIGQLTNRAPAIYELGIPTYVKIISVPTIFKPLRHVAPKVLTFRQHNILGALLLFSGTTGSTTTSTASRARPPAPRCSQTARAWAQRSRTRRSTPWAPSSARRRAACTTASCTTRPTGAARRSAATVVGSRCTRRTSTW